MSDTITIPRKTSGPADVPGEPVARSVGFRESRRAVAAMPLAGHTAPWPVTMLLWAGAAVAHHGGRPGAMIVAVAAPVAAVVWWWQYERSRTRRMRRKHRRHAALVTFAALAWLAWAGASGAGGWHAASLWIGHLVLLAPYWRRRTIPIPASAGGPAATPAEATFGYEGEPDGRLPEVVKWDTRVAVQGGAAPGSYLSGMDEVPNGLQWDIHLVAGRQTTMGIRGQQALLCSALDLPMDRLIVDGHPSGALSMARLIVVQGRPLAQQFDHPGPDKVYNPATGYAGVGMHADEQMAEWALFVPGWGLAGGVIVGGVGSGKSTLMKNIATIAKNTGILSVWACCPVGGQSFPALLANVDWPAYDIAAGMRQLRAMVRVIEVRGALNNVLGRELHVPTPDSPGIVGFIDEFHKLTSKSNPFHKEAIQLLEIIAREGRKAAVALIVADQTVNLQQTFGNNDVMRSNLWIKNLAVLRVSSEVEKGMIPGLEGVDPSELPERFPDGSPTSGLGYLRGQRTAPFRGWFTPTADAMLAAAPVIELDTITAKTIGDDYLLRRELRTQAQVDQALTLLELDPDLLAVIAQENPDLAAAIAADAAAGRPRHRPAAEPAVPSRVTSSGAVLSLAGAIGPAPALRLPEDPAPATAAASEDGGPARRVLELIRSGITTTGELQDAYGCGETRMRDLLNELLDRKKIVRVKKGQWRLATDADAEVPQLRSDRELLAHAAELIVTSQFGSGSMLQRKLRASWADTTRLLDDLHTLGAVGPATTTGAARDVLIGPDELPDLLDRIHGGRQAA